MRPSAPALARLLKYCVDVQHQMLKKIIGKYPPPLPGIMVDDVPGERKAVLDLGCGSGSWCNM